MIKMISNENQNQRLKAWPNQKQFFASNPRASLRMKLLLIPNILHFVWSCCWFLIILNFNTLLKVIVTYFPGKSWAAAYTSFIFSSFMAVITVAAFTCNKREINALVAKRQKIDKITVTTPEIVFIRVNAVTSTNVITIRTQRTVKGSVARPSRFAHVCVGSSDVLFRWRADNRSWLMIAEKVL